MLRRSCSRCGRQLSIPRHNARKKYCYRCEVTVRKERAEREHDAYVSRVYNVPPGSYKRLLAIQGGVCFICRRANGTVRRLAVDHDHKTGLVRGLICKPCNWLLGHARDDPQFFHRAAAYLACPPAQEVIYGHGPAAPPERGSADGAAQAA